MTEHSSAMLVQLSSNWLCKSYKEIIVHQEIMYSVHVWSLNLTIEHLHGVHLQHLAPT